MIIRCNEPVEAPALAGLREAVGWNRMEKRVRKPTDHILLPHRCL